MSTLLARLKAQGKMTPAQRRERLRDSLWHNSARLVWHRQSSKGFTTIPRILPLVAALMAQLSPRGDPGRVYFDLWCRAFDEGMVTISDDEGCAYSSGYSGPRAVRTWREHIETLAQLGFVLVKQQGNREIAHVLLLHPLSVCSKLRAEGKINDAWWNAFVARCSEIGAEITEFVPESPSEEVQAMQ